jgi:hypothetical protein
MNNRKVLFLLASFLLPLLLVLPTYTQETISGSERLLSTLRRLSFRLPLWR